MKSANLRNSARLLPLAAILLALSSFARADVIPASWTETIDFNPDISIPPAHTYEHDLTTDGFQPLADVIESYDLYVDLYDDEDRFSFTPEFAIIDLPGLLGDRTYFSVGGTHTGGESLTGWAQLNLLGTLTVTIDNFLGVGDFMLGGSRLVARGYSHTTTAVSEPGTLALFGLGLLGAAFARRRRIV